MAGRFAIHCRRRGVLAEADPSPNSSMRAPMSPVKEARKIDDLTVDFETIPAGSDLAAGADQLPDHVEGLVRGA